MTSSLKNMPFKLLAFLISIFSLCPGAYAFDAAHAFKTAPVSVLPTIDQTARMDMIDYYLSNMAVGTNNLLGGKSRVTGMDPMVIDVALSSSADCRIALLPLQQGDTAIIVVHTVRTPTPDSRMAIYSRDWSTNLTEKFFAQPSLKTWLNKDGLKNATEVETDLPFILSAYDFNPYSLTLKITTDPKSYISEEAFARIEPLLKPSLSYRWDGKKFNLEKNN